jgi:hypothetical protein
MNSADGFPSYLKENGGSLDGSFSPSPNRAANQSRAWPSSAALGLTAQHGDDPSMSAAVNANHENRCNGMTSILSETG